MHIIHSTRHRTAASAVLAVTLVAACGSGDGSSVADTAPDTSAATTEPDTTEPPETISPATSPPPTSPPPTGPPPTEPATTEPQVLDDVDASAPADCPEPVPMPVIEPVDPTATPFPPFDGLLPRMTAGRYSTSTLGFAMAIDIPTDDFVVPFQVGGNLVATDNPGGVIAFVRDDGYILSPPGSDGAGDEVDLDTWIAESPVTVVSDGQTTVAGFPARELVVRVPLVDDDDTIPFVAAWGLVSSPDVDQRVLVVDIGDPEPLLITVQPSVLGDAAFAAQVDTMLASLALGDPGPSLATVFAESPWNVGNLFGPPPEYVDAGCAVPLVGFGGAEFELAESTRIRGAGDEIFLIDPEGPFVGVSPPTIQLVAPEFAAVDDTLPDPPPAAPITTIDDAVAQLTAEGYDLTAIESDSTLLGAPVTAFDFVGPQEPPNLWVPRSHAASASDPNVAEEPFRSGTVHIADTDVGVLVVMVEGEASTDDVDLMRERFEMLVETLRHP